jgi:peptidyl-prolyl cis-trans isomerase C
MKRLTVFVLLLMALFACQKKEAGQTGQTGPFLAKVGNVAITQADYDREFAALPDYAQQMFKGNEGKENFLNEIVKKEILYQEALKKGLDKSPEFRQKVEDFKKLTLISELIGQEVMSKAKVSDQEVKDYYNKHKEDFATTSQIRASHILVKTEDEANKVLERLKKGEKFETLARELSLDKASAKHGGDVGFFGRGQMVPEFERAAASLKVGQISEPVKTQFGYHIIKVTGRKTGPVLPFDRVKEVIAQKLAGERQKEAFDKYIDEIRKNYTVTINKEAVQAMQPETAPAPPAESNAAAKKDEK